MECHSILFNKENASKLDLELLSYLSEYDHSSVTPSELKDLLVKYFDNHGWIKNFKYSPEMSTTITAVKQLTGVCAPLGNIARMFYDFLKLQYCYKAGIITNGIIVCPLLPRGNRAYIERLDRELSIYKLVIDIPLFVIGVSIEET